MATKNKTWTLIQKWKEKYQKGPNGWPLCSLIEQVLSTRDAGQDEYARDKDNAFANFERVALFTGVTREKALLVYMIKHIDGLWLMQTDIILKEKTLEEDLQM